MIDCDKVIKGLIHCTAWNGLHECQPKVGDDCPYEDEADCKLSIMYDALAVIKEQKKEIKRLKLELKEQEIGHWVVLKNCSNAGVYCSECHKKIFDHYPMRKQLSYFCPHCGTRIEGQAVKRE